jgi:hypothetical protein
MVDVDTFLTTLYVLVDEECKAHPMAPPLKPEAHQGRPARLSESEVVTLALFGQWALFRSERAFYRYAERHLRPAFPTLPVRSQYNRLLRRSIARLMAIVRQVAARIGAATCLYQAVDTTGIPTRNCKRRHFGWLPADVTLGYCNRVGWYEGFRLLTCVTEHGALTGFGIAEAHRKDQVIAETFFAARAYPQSRLLSVGDYYGGYYVVDTGFEGRDRLAHWAADYEAFVLCMPNRSRRPTPWPKPLRRWFAGGRQIVETAHARLMDTFGLTQDRPHTRDGFQARLAAKMALHNVCCWLNRQWGRPLLAFADLLDW